MELPSFLNPQTFRRRSAEPCLNFFIRRPIVAIVISILMVIIGAITIVSLPVAQFPDIAPPEIRVQALYPGADAETMEKAVATPIEQQINGVDNMDYMYSLNSTNNSSTALMVDFDLNTDPNMDLSSPSLASNWLLASFLQRSTSSVST